MKSTQLTILSAPDHLKNDVECFSIVEHYGDEPLSISVSPKAVPGLVFQHHQRHSALTSIVSDASQILATPTLFLYGAGIKPSVMNFSGGTYTSIQIILKPHALHSLFGINASVINDGMALALNEIVKNNLEERLFETDEQQEQIALLTAFLVNQLVQNKRRDQVIEKGLQLIHRDIAGVSVPSLLNHLSISERQFERRFRQTVGVSPHAYIRVKRFNEAVRLIKGRHFKTLTEVAHHLHLYDQSHLIREIQTFSGMTPKSISQKVDDFYHDQVGYSYLDR